MWTSRRRGDGGESLVELLISIVIIGIAFPAILGSLALTNKGSGQHRQQAEVATLLRAAAEMAQDPVANPWPVTPKACPASVTLPVGANATLEFFKDDETDPGLQWRTDQAWTTTSLNGCQLVRIRLTASASGFTETVTVTRRKP